MKRKTWEKKGIKRSMIYLRRTFILIITFVFASSFSTRNSAFFIKPVFIPEFMEQATPWADSLLNTLSLDEKIAQLLMVQVYSNASKEEINETEKQIRKYKLGGIIFSKGGPVQQANLTNHFQEISDIPMLIAMDAEWGLSMRLDSTIIYPYQMTLGAINDNSLIYLLGSQIAEQCKRLGVHMNFAPVVDINNNALNPVINYRSFGEDRENVMSKGLMYMLGMQDNKLLTTIKHFPGHGDTEKDSHKTLPVINHSREHLDSLEIYPFEQLINNGASGVMIAHLHIPSLDSTTDMASTLSPHIVTDLLKKQMGFGGLIVTDALSMKGVSDYFNPGELEAQAIKAGNDILLMPSDVSKAISQIKKEIRRGRIDEEDIDHRCHKVLKAKEWVGLNNYKPVETKNLVHDLNKPEYKVLNNKLIANSLVLLKNNDDIIPIKHLDTLNIAVVSLNSSETTEFQKTINLYLESDHFVLNNNSEGEFKKVFDTLNHYNLIIIGLHNTNNSLSNYYGIKKKHLEFIADVSEHYKNVILNVFSNPYGLKYFKSFRNIKALTMACQTDEEYEIQMAQALFGGIPFRGNIPVNSHHELKMHQGFNTLSGRLSYNIPEYVGLNSDTLAKIENIVEDAIKARATPGCQIVVARKGVVVYNRSFGYHTYRKKRKVLGNDVYDIASLTKIFATTSAIMKLHDEGKINIDTTLSTYLNYLDTTNKKDLIIKDIMLHNARLPSWIPFYMSTLEGLYPERELFSKRSSDFYPLQYYKNTYITRFLKYVDGIYTKEPDGLHKTKVADALYLLDSYRDTIFYKIGSCELREKNDYKYSDLGFYLLYDAVERITGKPFQNYVYDNFYAPLGAKYTTYLPLEKLTRNRITPTEDDLIFRRQLVHGYVHDPGAAMLGGVSGHAGLFSNANDLSKILQMWLDGGEYGYIRYFNKETIGRFTLCPYCDVDNRRGIGFDKPPLDKNGPSAVSKYCSDKSFGHTGFTGTISWVDPEYDLVYVFLSNRVHPDQNNNSLAQQDIRTRIQDLIYNAIEK